MGGASGVKVAVGGGGGVKVAVGAWVAVGSVVGVAVAVRVGLGVGVGAKSDSGTALQASSVITTPASKRGFQWRGMAKCSRSGPGGQAGQAALAGGLSALVERLVVHGQQVAMPLRQVVGQCLFHSRDFEDGQFL